MFYMAQRVGSESQPTAKQGILMRALSFVSLVLVNCSLCLAEGLPRSTPEEQGVASAAVLSFIDAVDKNVDSLNSFMLVRHGHVVAEGWWAPYDAASRH